MPDILKTLESWREPRRVADFLRRDYVRYYFSLGRGKPQKQIERLYFTYRGSVIGFFQQIEIIQNYGQLPKLRKMDGSEDSWQIKPDAWVAVCTPPFYRLKPPHVFHTGFRGWRYFNLGLYSQSVDARVHV